MKYYYPVIFFPDGDSFGVVVPDLDGCFSRGDDLTQAMYWAQPAIGTWLDGVDEKDYPCPSNPGEIDTSDYPCAIVNVIEFDPEKWQASLNPIRRAQIAAGLSIKELADLLGAPYRTIQDWVYGTHKPPAWLTRLIVERFKAPSKKNAPAKIQRGIFISGIIGYERGKFGGRGGSHKAGKAHTS